MSNVSLVHYMLIQILCMYLIVIYFGCHKATYLVKIETISKLFLCCFTIGANYIFNPCYRAHIQGHVPFPNIYMIQATYPPHNLQIQ